MSIEPTSTSRPRSSPVKGNEPELDRAGDVAETNSGGRDGLPLESDSPGVVAPVPLVGGAVVLTPPTAPDGVPGVLVGVWLAVVAPEVGEHFDGTGVPTHVDGGVLEQLDDDVGVHGVHEFDDVGVHGVHEFDDVGVHGAHEFDDVGVHGVHEFDDVGVHGAHEFDDVGVHGGMQPVWAGLVLPMPWLRSHS